MIMVKASGNWMELESIIFGQILILVRSNGIRISLNGVLESQGRQAASISIAVAEVILASKHTDR